MNKSKYFVQDVFDPTTEKVSYVVASLVDGFSVPYNSQKLSAVDAQVICDNLNGGQVPSIPTPADLHAIQDIVISLQDALIETLQERIKNLEELIAAQDGLIKSLQELEL